VGDFNISELWWGLDTDNSESVGKQLRQHLRNTKVKLEKSHLIKD